jgi:hypothetical protein
MHFLTRYCTKDIHERNLLRVALNNKQEILIENVIVKIDKIENRLEETEFKPETLYGDAGFVNGESILKQDKKADDKLNLVLFKGLQKLFIYRTDELNEIISLFQEVSDD